MARWQLYKWVAPFNSQEECRNAIKSLAEIIGYTPEQSPIQAVDNGDLLKLEVAAWDKTYVQASYASKNGSPHLRTLKQCLGEPEESDTLLESMPVKNFM